MRVLLMSMRFIMTVVMRLTTAEVACVETLFQMHDLHLGVVLHQARQPHLLEGHTDGEIERNRRQLGHLARGRVVGVRAVARLDQRGDLDMLTGQLIDHPRDGRHADGHMQRGAVLGVGGRRRERGKRAQHTQRQSTRSPRTQRALDPGQQLFTQHLARRQGRARMHTHDTTSFASDHGMMRARRAENRHARTAISRG